ncbi:retropepsin-like aspartic protease [Brevundimonas sp.]|uniref:retropepsin-like aspartic protease n=1 Tax=Brevundimonas sp. TaxID=1871086 RepID=UPI0026376DC2|nr:retropepsin-like aspartic protease [Brevundimonas sp.]
MKTGVLFLALAIFTALSGTASAQSIRGAPPPLEIIGDQMSVDIGRRQGAPLVPVMINGQGPFHLILDTGAAPQVVLSPKIIQQLNLEPVGMALIGDPSGNAPQEAAIYGDLRLEIGEITFERVSAIENGALGIDGVIGAGLFDTFRVNLDFGQNRLSFDRLALPEPDGETVHDFRLDRGLIMVDLSVGQVRVPAHVDIGQSVSPLIMPEALALSLPRLGEPRKVGTARSVSSTMDVMAVDLAVPVRLNNQILGVTTAAYPSLLNAANLGAGAFARNVLTLDYPNRRLQISTPR